MQPTISLTNSKNSDDEAFEKPMNSPKLGSSIISGSFSIFTKDDVSRKTNWFTEVSPIKYVF